MKGCIRKKVIESNGFKIGMFGVCTKDTVTLSAPGKSVRFESVVQTSKILVKELKEVDECDVIIALTHLSIAEDRELARRVHGIDVMLGGHDHTPHTQTQGHTFIHKAGVDAQYLARIKLYIEKKETIVGEKKIVKTCVFPEWKMILNRNIEPDHEVDQKVAKYIAELPVDNAEEIGLCETSLNSCTESVRSKETSFANLTTDAIREAYGADVAMFNGGGIRGDRGYDAGSRLTKGDIRKEFPFTNGAALVEMTGQTIWNTAEAGLGRAEHKLGSFPHFSKGVHIVYDVTREPGKRIETFELNGVPLDMEKTYKFASTTYMLNGGDGYAAMKNHTPVDHSLNNASICDIVTNHVVKHQIITAKKEGRVYLCSKKLEADF
jgi:5'-nucleotidase/UDP-sugar diphosphatase